MTKTLIPLLFKNSSLWLDDFINCLSKLLEYNKSREEPIDYTISILCGNSDDDTEELLNKRIDELRKNFNLLDITLATVNLPDRFDIIQKLSILRNIFPSIHNNFKNYNYILPIDTDILFEPYVIERLIRNIRNPKLSNIGIIAPMIFIDNHKSYGNSFFYDTFAYRMKGKGFLHKKPYIPIELDKNNKSKWILPIDSVGSLYLAKADIFSKYNITYGTYIRNDLSNHPHRLYESEQVIFCNKIRQNTPYQIYVDLNSKVYHINLENYGLQWH